MSFVGKLDQFKITDLLQILATTGKSGRLSLTCREGQGLIAFRRGKIIYAATSSARETLGNLLLCQRLITEEALVRALELQESSSEDTRLGTILVDSGGLSRAELERVIREQVERVIAEFLTWDSGYFKFDVLDFPDHGEIGVDAEDFLLSEGLSADQVLLKITTELDDALKDGAEAAAEPGGGDAAPAAPAPREGGPSLREVMAEIRSPEFTGEVTSKILQFARGVVRRGVLFFIRQGEFCGMGQFGVGPAAGADDRIRELRIPADQPSVLTEAVERKGAYRGPLDLVEWNHYLIEQLGGHHPRDVLALPLLVNDAVLLVFYGDNLPGDEPIGPYNELELLMLQAGLAMEENLLEKRMEQFKRLRSAR